VPFPKAISSSTNDNNNENQNNANNSLAGLKLQRASRLQKKDRGAPLDTGEILSAIEGRLWD
jgi:hypothetical protein